MEIIDHVGEKFCGYAVPPYRLYDVGSNVTVLFSHGQGEIGPADGSKLNLVEKIGLPAEIKAGRVVPKFNVVATQVDLSYSLSNKFILQWLKWKMKSLVVGATGLSLGGLRTYNLWAMDEEKILDFIIPVCGYLAQNTIPALRPIPVQSWHGTLDTTVSYQTDLNFVKAYNATDKQPKIDWHPLEGIGHNAWTAAYSSPMLYKFMDDQIAAALAKIQKPLGLEDFKLKAVNAIQGITA